MSNMDIIGTGPNILRSKITFQEPEDGLSVSSFFYEKFKKFSSKPLIIDSQNQNKWTGWQLLDATSRIAKYLIKRLGLKSGQNVLLICDHSDREIVTAFGTLMAGCSFYAQNPDDGIEEIRTICEIIDVKAIATNMKNHNLAIELRKSSSKFSNAPILWIDDLTRQDDVEVDCNNNDSNWDTKALIQRDEVILLDDIIHNYPADLEFIENHCKSIDSKATPCYYVLTSGSSGFPKVVELTQFQVINSIHSMLSALSSHVNNESGETLLPFRSSTIFAGDLPMDHSASLCFMILLMSIGAKYVCLPVGDIDAFWQGVNDYSIDTCMNGASHVFKLLQRLKEVHGQNKWNVSSLRFVASAGAKMNYTELVHEIRRLYPNMRIGQSYGLSEMGYVSCLPFSEVDEHLESIGYIFPGLVGCVVDSDGNNLGPNERGELYVWGPNKFNAYLCRPGIDSKKAWAECHDRRGYYKTGDLVHYDTDGRLYIHGRIKETLTLRGEWKILPAELEEIVNKHPLIEYSAIIGLPDPDYPSVQVPRAFVKLISIESKKYRQLVDSNSDNILVRMLADNDLNSLRQHIMDFVSERTADAKHLRGGVFIMDELPKNGRLQKIDRKVLRQMSVNLSASMAS